MPVVPIGLNLEPKHDTQVQVVPARHELNRVMPCLDRAKKIVLQGPVWTCILGMQRGRYDSYESPSTQPDSDAVETYEHHVQI